MTSDVRSMTRPEEDPGAVKGPGGIVVPVMLVAPSAVVPEAAYEGDAALDLFAAEGKVIPPLGRGVVGTGIALGLPPGLAALTLPRSGLAARRGISLVNSPGLIDPGYRGEIKIVLHNTDRSEPFTVHVGDRIAQLLFVPLTTVSLQVVDALDRTERAHRGFGSSGRGLGRTL
jgi:dUTP pyrophosphatase